MLGFGSRVMLCGALGAVLVVAGPTGSAAQPAQEDLAPGKVQVLGIYPEKPRKDGEKVHPYHLVGKGKPFKLRLGGPAAFVLMARGMGKDEVGVSVGLELDGSEEKRVEIRLLAKESRILYLKVPEGTHELLVKPSTGVLFLPLGVKREPMAGEQVVAFEGPGETDQDPEPIALIPVGTTPAAGEKPEDAAEEKPKDAAEEIPVVALPPPDVKAEEEREPLPDPSPSEPVPDTGTEASVVKDGESEPSEPYLGVGLVVDLLITSGKPSSTKLSAGESSPSGSTGLAIPLLLSAKGYLSVTDMLSIVPGIEIGWFRLSGDGTLELPNDPDFNNLGYSWTIDSLPIFLGVSAMLKPLADLPLYLSAGGGFAAVYAWAESTVEKEGHKVTSAVQSDWGVGWYLGIEAAWVLGPGRFTLEYRYSSVRTDLKLQDIYGGPFNEELGDLEGSNLLLGYRLDF